jgi:hypothetical protein
MRIKFVQDYSVLLASQETKIYHKDQIVNCRNEEKAQQMIDQGYAIAEVEVE